jgi:hypothetical protein
MDSLERDNFTNDRGHLSAIVRAAHKRLDPMDGPRTLGAKRYALQAQKLRRAVLEWHVGLARTDCGHDSGLLVSKDGTTAFAISRRRSGLFVEKRHCPTSGPRTSHAMIFANELIFDQWCDVEPTRFGDPLLCDQLRRRGHELFAKHR